MLVNLGRGLSPASKLLNVIGGTVSAYSSFEINLGEDTGNWQAISELLMYDADGNEFAQSLTAVGETVLTMEGLSPGQLTSDSTYGTGTTDAGMIDGTPSPLVAGAGSGTAQWSDSASVPLRIFVKPSVAVSIGKIEMCVSTAYGWLPSHAHFKADGGVLTPLSSPADVNDFFQSTSTGSIRWYRWTF